MGQSRANFKVFIGLSFTSRDSADPTNPAEELNQKDGTEIRVCGGEDW